MILLVPVVGDILYRHDLLYRETLVRTARLQMLYQKHTGLPVNETRLDSITFPLQSVF